MRRHHSRKKNSTKVFAVVALAAAIIFGVSTYFLSKENGIVVAKVNGQKIFKAEVENKLRTVFEGQNFGNGSDVKIPEIATLPKEVIEILAKEIYLDRELTKEAQKSKAAKSKDLKVKIAENKDRMIRQAYINSILKEKVSEEKVRDKYAELSNDLTGKKEYLISHIVTKTKEEADKVRGELKKGKFADLAKKYSIDQDSVNNGGNLGYILEDNMFKEISDVIVKLKKDEVSAPVQSKFGWHLLKVSDSRDAVALPFEAVKDNIREQLSQDALNEINAKITKDAKIKIVIKLQETPAAAAPAEEKAVDEKANAVAAPEAATEEKAEAKTEVKAEEKTEAKAEKKSENNASKTQKDSKSKPKK